MSPVCFFNSTVQTDQRLCKDASYTRFLCAIIIYSVILLLSYVFNVAKHLGQGINLGSMHPWFPYNSVN